MVVFGVCVAHDTSDPSCTKLGALERSNDFGFERGPVDFMVVYAVSRGSDCLHVPGRKLRVIA